MRSNRRRPNVAWLMGLVVLMLVLGADPALADAPGPTDYLSEVVAIEPANDAISLRMIGGDSFIELVVTEGHVVEVIGYRGEPYLRFESDGTVLENQFSPTKYLNEERYGTDTGPTSVDPSAAPKWAEVASGGRYSWHDHRTHWMNEKKPPGAEPGDRVLEQVVPLVVDGEEVDVTVVSTLQEPPQPFGVLFGGALAAGVSLALFRGLMWGQLTMWLGAGAAVACVFGALAYWSVPSETGPSVLLWLAPVLALASAGIGHLSQSLVFRHGMLLLGGVELALWGWLRRGAFSAALLPSNAPDWLDRASVSLALVSGAIAAFAGLVGLVRVLSAPAPTRTAN